MSERLPMFFVRPSVSSFLEVQVEAVFSEWPTNRGTSDNPSSVNHAGNVSYRLGRYGGVLRPRPPRQADSRRKPTSSPSYVNGETEHSTPPSGVITLTASPNSATPSRSP